jgi:L-ascorbate metabolism protein UlaG (beta-lactamase superfamily)
MSPITASLHLVDYQLKVMTSYLENPALHVAASKDPDLVSGPFMNVPSARKNEIEALLDETRKKQAGNIELACAFMQFVKRLVAEAKGCSLETFYAQVPEILRGYVELVYDYHDRPSVRVLEKLLYDSYFYDPTLQSYRIGLMKTDSSRTFILNTPRLPELGEIDWKLPFDSPIADELFKLDLQPQRLDQILDTLSGSPATEGLILPFLSDQPFVRPASWKEKRIRIRYFGHACVLVEWNGVSVLTDAYIPVRPLAGGVERFSFNDLPEKIDFVLITHNHQDHYVFESLLRLRHRIGCLVVPKSYGMLYGDLSLKVLSGKLGFRNVVEMDTLDSIPLPDGEIIGIPFFGEHADLAHGKIAYVIRCGKEQMLFAADSDCLDRKMYERVRQSIGPVQTAFLSIENVGAPLSWVNGALLPQQPRAEIEQQRRYHACDCRRALELMEALESKRLYSYAMGLEPWMDHLLGLHMTEESEQWKQSERILVAAQGRGFWTAERLCGSRSFHLDDPSETTLKDGTAEVDLRADHWKRHLNGAKHFQLGTHTFQSRGGNYQKTVLDLPLSDEIEHFIAGEAQFRLAAFSIAALLSSLGLWTEQEDFVVAVCMKDGDRVHHFPLRVDISGNPAFAALVARVERALLGALAYELSFPRIMDLAKEVFSRRNASDGRVGFVFCANNAATESDQHFPSADWSELCDLEVRLAQQLIPRLNLEFDGSIFDEVVAEQLAGSLLESMRQGLKNPAQCLSDLNLALQEHPALMGKDVEEQFAF